MSKNYIPASTRKLLSSIKSFKGPYLTYSRNAGYWINGENAKVALRVRYIFQLKSLEKKGYIKLRYVEASMLNRVFIDVLK